MLIRVPVSRQARQRTSPLAINCLARWRGPSTRSVVGWPQAWHGPTMRCWTRPFRGPPQRTAMMRWVDWAMGHSVLAWVLKANNPRSVLVNRASLPLVWISRRMAL